MREYNNIRDFQCLGIFMAFNIQMKHWIHEFWFILHPIHSCYQSCHVKGWHGIHGFRFPNEIFKNAPKYADKRIRASVLNKFICDLDRQIKSRWDLYRVVEAWGMWTAQTFGGINNFRLSRHNHPNYKTIFSSWHRPVKVVNFRQSGLCCWKLSDNFLAAMFEI